MNKHLQGKGNIIKVVSDEYKTISTFLNLYYPSSISKSHPTIFFSARGISRRKDEGKGKAGMISTSKGAGTERGEALILIRCCQQSQFLMAPPPISGRMDNVLVGIRAPVCGLSAETAS